MLPKTLNVPEAGKVIGAIAVCQSAAIIGLFFAASAIPTWYANLAKPEWSLPEWTFAPIWIILYTLMGISLFLVWRARTKENCHCTALQLFFFQLFLGTLWTYLLFGMREPMLAFFGIIPLLFAVIATIGHFWTISKPAAYLFMPYAAWIAFAAILNYSIWQLNF